MYGTHGDSIIIDSYIPADGLYIIVSEKNNILKETERITIKLDKKTKEIDRTIDNFDFIASVDYMSKVVDMNKPIDKKKIIQSNNYLSFVIKKESLVNGKLTNEIIDGYYEILENPIKKYDKSKKSKELYESIEERNGKVNTQRLNIVKEWIKDNIFNLLEKEDIDKGYLKIFFNFDKFDLSEYKKESEKYIIPNLYNSNDFNIKINGYIYGLPNDNMGLNSKKPYLENKSRKTKVPYLINQDDVMIQKKIFDYLMNLASIGITNIYINDKEIKAIKNGELIDEEDFSGIYLRIQKGKEVEIIDSDTINSYNNNIKPMNFENILQGDIKNLKQSYGEINTIHEMQRLINEVFFSKFLINNYFTEAKDISINDSNLKRNLILARSALFTWFYKGNTSSLYKVINIISLSLIKDSINNAYFYKAVEQFNLRSSLIRYLKGGESMADILIDNKNKLREKIIMKDTGSIESDKEYFFAVGQLINYFMSKNKGSKKVQSLINPIINAKSDERLKEELKRLYKKYNYDIDQYSRKFNNMFAMVSSYKPEERIDDDLIIAGYLHSNLIFEKSEK
ncbi:type I-B CRISPR-associated protein Cas8b/Csh1 [Clostridium sardiniense]|uniref:Type I-B CRISPR-associated protein Cas8b/Csh1 n=2 Tax=Clostridium sardiniense TaxID=29369 RepID=A0ABS7KZV0_CLOSR|nr:type I-B CRISPR-associated protein Cas8b/Csh1 [Clostridium sardiniense]